jgi:aminoglycoside phosphotransferase
VASATIGRDIEQALDHHRMPSCRLVPISRAETRKHGRRAYRVELEDGRTIKARWLESEETCRRLVALRTGIDAAFAPVIGHHGRVLLEAWIDGAPLSALDADVRADEAGALLGRLHATDVDDLPATLPTHTWRQRATAELAALAQARVLDDAAVATLAAELRRRDPGSAAVVLAHRDFCAENMLIDRHQRLHVIDNEWLAIAPAAFDLGRTFSRWPMPDGVWRRFIAAYRSAARFDPGPLAFWTIVAAVKSARIRLREGPDRLAVPLAVLRRSVEHPSCLTVPTVAE